MDSSPETTYNEIQHTVPSDLEERVLAIIQQHIGMQHRISRRALVEQAFHTRIDDENISNSRMDRQVRIAVESLQSRHPILSTSGGGGKYYPARPPKNPPNPPTHNTRPMNMLHGAPGQALSEGHPDGVGAVICPVRYQLILKSRTDPAALDELRAHITGCQDCLDFIRSFPADGPPAPEHEPKPVQVGAIVID
jgi:hypothetical protein